MWLNEISNSAVVNDEKFDSETWAEYFKKYWCPEKVVALPAGGQVSIKSTTRLDTGEMHHYLTKIEQWALGHMIELTIPEPSEYRQLQQKQEQ